MFRAFLLRESFIFAAVSLFVSRITVEIFRLGQCLCQGDAMLLILFEQHKIISNTYGCCCSVQDREDYVTMIGVGDGDLVTHSPMIATTRSGVAECARASMLVRLRYKTDLTKDLLLSNFNSIMKTAAIVLGNN